MIEPPPVPSQIQVGSSATSDDSQREFADQLFAKYRSSLHRYLTRLVGHNRAHELLQEAYVRFMRSADSLKVEALARASLFRTAMNVARDFHERTVTQRAHSHASKDDEHEPSDSRRPWRRLADERTLEAIERSLASLPKVTRTVFLLHRYRGLSFDEIASLLNISVLAVSRKMAEALAQLSSASSNLP